MLQFEINRETGDVILKSDHGMLIIDQQDRDYLTDQLRHASDSMLISIPQTKLGMLLLSRA